MKKSMPLMLLMVSLPLPVLCQTQDEVFDKPLAVTLPVHWDVNRTYIKQEHTSTESETFFEYWTLYRSPHMGAYLKSPRATTPIVFLGTLDPLSKLTPKFVISLNQLGELLGLNTQIVEGVTPIIIEIFSVSKSQAIPLPTLTKSHITVSLHIK